VGKEAHGGHSRAPQEKDSAPYAESSCRHKQKRRKKLEPPLHFWPNWGAVTKKKYVKGNRSKPKKKKKKKGKVPEKNIQKKQRLEICPTSSGRAIIRVETPDNKTVTGGRLPSITGENKNSLSDINSHRI